MGLGPPVCEKCRVIIECTILNVCKYCGNLKPQWNAWDCGLTEEELYENKLFLDFVKGEDNAPTGR